MLIQSRLCPVGLETVGVGLFRLSLHPMSGMSPGREASRPVLSFQGLLALEGELTPILVQMVKSANMNGLLDSDSDSLSSCQHRVKARLHHILQQDAPFGPEDYDQVTCASSLYPSYPAT